MKKMLIREIEIPDGVEFNIDGSEIVVNGKEGQNKRRFNLGKLEFKKEKNKITISAKKATKREKKQMNTIVAHIMNMVKGVQDRFEYKLKICFSHFPISVEVKNQEVTIKNFLGEKIPRRLKLPTDVEVKVDKDNIIISSANKELAGMAATSFERTTRIRGRDRRVFQDGIYITNKPGRDI